MTSADSVFTLADLDAWPVTGTWLAVLGHPIKHSVSPAMHNAALAMLAKTQPAFADWHYVRFDVLPEELPQALKLLRIHRFLGLNLTVPHKVLAMKQVSVVDEAARPIGAINTLLATESDWKGFNTDGYGLSAGLRASLGIALRGADVILLGAGGAARSAAVECLQNGAASVWIANRTAANLEALLADLRPLTPAGTRLEGFAPHALPHSLPSGSILINATSAGLKPGDPSAIDLSALPKPKAVFDMIYNPPQTPLLKQAASLGIPHAHGLPMLVNQGAKALALWTGQPAASLVPVMGAAANQALFGA